MKTNYQAFAFSPINWLSKQVDFQSAIDLKHYSVVRILSLNKKRLKKSEACSGPLGGGVGTLQLVCVCGGTVGLPDIF